jgi:hypothetical protein
MRVILLSLVVKHKKTAQRRRFVKKFFFLGLGVICFLFFVFYKPSYTEERIEATPHEAITKKNKSLTGVYSDFYTRWAHDQWIDKTYLGIPANKHLSISLLRLRTLYYTREEAEQELENLKTQKNVRSDFIIAFQDAIDWGEEQKAKSSEELLLLAEEYPKIVKDPMLQNDYETYFFILGSAKKRMNK